MHRGGAGQPSLPSLVLLVSFNTVSTDLIARNTSLSLPINLPVPMTHSDRELRYVQCHLSCSAESQI